MSELPEQPAESTETARPAASRTTLETSSTGTEPDQDGVPVAEPLADRPMVPTTPADWESKKQIIRELYMDQNKILNEVIEIMITKHKFKATARMYKGQFAKWKWYKYNKSGSHGAGKPTKSRTMKRRSARARAQRPFDLIDMPEPIRTQSRQAVPLSQGLYLQHFSDEECQVESTLNTYAALICHWLESETPWRNDSQYHSASSPPFGQQQLSVLQHVRAAQDHFLAGRVQRGGELLRAAFLRIESAVDSGLGVEAVWDCCLAVPQLALTHGWTDMLSIFSRYLHQLTSIKLRDGHPITRIAASLHKLSSSSCFSPQNNNNSTTSSRNWQLEMYVTRAWQLWIDSSLRTRGARDDVTIHLKRGYVTLLDPAHPMTATLIADFVSGLQDSLAERGAFATTSRILELEHLLARMFVPLFTPASARNAEGMLTGLRGRVEGRNKGREVAEWAYMDRYLVFSADNFMASIAECMGERDKAAGYRRRVWRDERQPRDLFWLQTSLLLEARLRAEGGHEEANAIQEARAEVQGGLGVELRLTGRLELVEEEDQGVVRDGRFAGPDVRAEDGRIQIH
ncbi:hypothetical protein C8A03DRAFT_19079 [Achaetomium macrosporum]|uniref:Clr5 domain-containing protein n=1 Tax=Achaetomium macrosporum TaxID=79813 RepID=A0AAN7C2P6_9PEZI|nr:hypothetical protein C8A03DRAFT_19079 [Achaetomium macrosporum]